MQVIDSVVSIRSRSAGPNSLLHLLHRQIGRACYNFAGFGIEVRHNLSMNTLFCQIRLRLPVQFCQPFSDLKPALFKSFAMFAVWTVDSQKGQQVTS